MSEILYTIGAGLPKPTRYADEKETVYGDALDLASLLIAGYLAVANGDANYTLKDIGSARESRTLALKFTSTMTAARNILIDTTTADKYRGRLFIIWNATAGGFKLTVKTTAGGSTGIDITNGYARLLWHDGPNVYAIGPENNPTTGLASFTAPSFLNSWVNYGSIYYNAGYALHFGIVYLRGLIKSGTLGAAAFTLPAGYRPSAQLVLTALSNDALGRVDITSGGNVVPGGLPGIGSNVYYSLDGISFVPS